MVHFLSLVVDYVVFIFHDFLLCRSGRVRFRLNLTPPSIEGIEGRNSAIGPTEYYELTDEIVLSLQIYAVKHQWLPRCYQ